MDHYERTIHGRELNEISGSRHHMVKIFTSDDAETLEGQINTWLEKCREESHPVTVVSRHFTTTADNFMKSAMHYSVALFFTVKLE